MGKKILTVDLSFPPKEEQPEEAPEDNKDEYAEVKEEAVIEDPAPAKPKRKAAAKKAIVPPEPVIESVVVESDVEAEVQPVPPPVIETREQPKVKCQHCNKEMSMKSLKYSHSRNCLGLKKTIEKVSNEKVSQKTEDIKPRAVSAPPPTPEPVLVAPTLPIKMKSS